jgi:hypothetical protein
VVEISTQYLVKIRDVLDGKIQPDSIEPRYILIGSGTGRLVETIEGINYMAKFGWRPIGISLSEGGSSQCLMEREE